MTLWETAVCNSKNWCHVQYMTRTHERTPQPDLISVLKSITCIQSKNESSAVSHDITETMCMKHALALTQALRTAYRYGNVDRLEKDHRSTYSCDFFFSLRRESWASASCAPVLGITLDRCTSMSSQCRACTLRFSSSATHAGALPVSATGQSAAQPQQGSRAVFCARAVLSLLDGWLAHCLLP